MSKVRLKLENSIKDRPPTNDFVTELELKNVQTEFSAFSQYIALTSVEFTGNDNFIAEYCFTLDDKLKTVKLTEDIVEISKGAFYACSELEDINLENVRIIRSDAFKFTPKLKKVNLGKVKKLCSDAFKNSGIKEAILPEIKSLGELAFSESDVEKIMIGGKLKEICDYAFTYTSMLKRVILCEGVETIKSRAFQYSNVQTIVLPTTIKNLEPRVFEDCDNLKTITIDLTKEQIKKIKGYEELDYAEKNGVKIKVKKGLEEYIGQYLEEGRELKYINKKIAEYKKKEQKYGLDK